MSRKFTAEEMRDYADAIAGDLGDNDHGCVEYSFDDLIPVVEALRQAADEMERKEREEREKKYEFSVYPPEVNGVFQYRDGAELKALMLKHAGYRDGIIVRRSVGEWEEV